MKNEMKAIKKATAEVIEQLLCGVRKATKYLSPTLVIKASRTFKVDKRNRRDTFVVTVGTPNYAERMFIKDCQKAEVSFPIRRVQLKFYPNVR